MTAWRRPGRRRSRTAASIVIGSAERSRRDVEVIPVLPGQHRRQPEQRAGRDRAGRPQPQPRRPVHQVAGQSRHRDRQQEERGRRASRQSDRGHQPPGQRHRRVEPELDPGRRGQLPGEPRVAQVHDLVCHPPQVPDVARQVPDGRHPAGQVRRPGARSPRSRRPGNTPAAQAAGLLAAPPAVRGPRRPQPAARGSSPPAARARPAPARPPPPAGCPRRPAVAAARAAPGGASRATGSRLIARGPGRLSAGQHHSRRRLAYARHRLSCGSPPALSRVLRSGFASCLPPSFAPRAVPRSPACCVPP